MGRYTNYELITNELNENELAFVPGDARELMSTGHCSRKWWGTYEEDVAASVKSLGRGMVVKTSTEFFDKPCFSFFSIKWVGVLPQVTVTHVIPLSEEEEVDETIMELIEAPNGNNFWVPSNFAIAFRLMEGFQLDEALEPVSLKF